MKLTKLKKIINDNDFENARLIIYLILFITFVYLAYFSHFNCSGCTLCGMTRAVKSLLVLDFKSAFEFNSMVWIFFIILPIIFMDILIIIKHKILSTKDKITKI